LPYLTQYPKLTTFETQERRLSVLVAPTKKGCEIMSTKKFVLMIVPIVILAVVVLTIMIASLFSFIRDMRQPAVRLEIGGTVYIDTSGMRSIYIEDNAPTPRFIHQFTFTNTETQTIVSSFPPTSTRTYSVGVVTVNNEIRSGRFGTRIATVYLDTGTYTIEFLPYEGTGEFVWGGVSDVIFRFVIQTFALMLVLGLLAIAFIAIVIIRDKKRNKIYMT